MCVNIAYSQDGHQALVLLINMMCLEQLKPFEEQTLQSCCNLESCNELKTAITFFVLPIWYVVASFDKFEQNDLNPTQIQQ